jgi:hypothetical protein
MKRRRSGLAKNMEPFSLGRLLAAAGQRMRADLAERLIAHPGELGANREEIIRQFLRAYLPKRFEVSSGFAFDSAGHISQQLDVIIADALTCPRFETMGGVKFYPCEAVVAVGQVRSELTGRENLKECLGNLESAKTLDRSGGATVTNAIGPDNANDEREHLNQVFTFLFVTGKALAGKTVQLDLLEHVLKTAPHLWPNVVFALDQYLVTYCCDDGVCANPMHARGVAHQPCGDPDDLLMRFFVLVGRAAEATRVKPLPYWDYLHGAAPWSANVLHGTDDPPPYLSSVTTG